jgi:type I restriction enzyme M protein
VLVNASHEFRKGTPKNYLTDDAVARIAAAYLKGEPVDDLVTVIDRAKAKENDWNLSPSRYIANGETKALREIPEIVAELDALKKEEKALDAELAKVLAQL